MNTPCKGIIFRHHRHRIFKNVMEPKKLWYKREQRYKFYEFNRTYFANYDTLYFLKTVSCPGCEQCEPTWKLLRKYDPDFTHIRFDDLTHQGFYAFYIDSNGLLKLGLAAHITSDMVKHLKGKKVKK